MLFNSLGSNYSFRFILKTLFASNNEKYRKELQSFLSKKYGGEVILLYKGREALKLALDLLKLPRGSKIGINGFTCYAVYRAITDAGCRPVYLDIDEKTLNFSSSEVEDYENLRVLIIQNTLGNPCDISKIRNFCLENKIYLIEDLAHSVGTLHASKKEAGNYGDFVVLSFSQDKIIDAVSGGALIIRNKKYQRLIKNVIYKSLDLKIQLKDRIYPLLTFLIRKTYLLGLGKALHFLLKKFKVLSQPISEGKFINFHKLPNWYCQLVRMQFTSLDKVLKHRRKVASIYAKNIKQEILSDNVINNLPFSSNIRFPIFVENRREFMEYLKGFGVFVSDIWYDAPISPARLLKLTDYSGQCPISESVSERIVNLPTHINISLKDAENISDKINKWLNTL